MNFQVKIFSLQAMNSLLKIVFFIILSLSILLPSCKKPEEIELVKVITVPVSFITRTSASLEGSLINEGTDTVISFGFCWSKIPQPTFADNRIVTNYMTTSGKYINYISDLAPNTTCFVRAYAITVKSKIYGNQETFTTKPATVKTTFNPALTYQTISDIDGNSYKTIKIGTQEWLAENLKTTRYNDGSAIPLVTGENEWSRLTTPGYCWYNNDEAVFKNIYGGYYNWFAVNTGKLCPSGWHVPTEDDWKVFKLFLGMTLEQVEAGYFTETTVGNKIKETGTFNWAEGSVTSTNESGFTALPGGRRSTGPATFGGEGGGAGWWSASEFLPSHAVLSHWVGSSDGRIFKSDMLVKSYGLNIRCVKD
jgi:uncharacterized protein (TIGR02145 family)